MAIPVVPMLIDVPTVQGDPGDQTVEYTIIDAETLKIIKYGKTQRRSMADKALAPNEIVIEGGYSDTRYSVDMDETGFVVVPVPPTPDPVTIADVKYHQSIRLRGTDWYVTKKIETGAEIPEDVAAARQYIRDAATRLEEMYPDIPQDYKLNKYWVARKGNQPRTRRQSDPQENENGE
jgi:hypothetical protein